MLGARAFDTKPRTRFIGMLYARVATSARTTRMDAVSDEKPDVDSAGVYFVTVEEFENRKPSDNAPEPPPGEQPDENPIESATRASPISEGPAATPRKLIPAEAHAKPGDLVTTIRTGISHSRWAATQLPG